MAIRIVDFKKIDLTNSEWDMYVAMCRSYDRPNFKGEELFRDLFETDEKTGIIIFLKPPSRMASSMEVFLFLMSIMQHQHLRAMREQVDIACQKMESAMASIKENIK